MQKNKLLRWQDLHRYDDAGAQVSGLRLPEQSAPNPTIYKGGQVLAFAGNATDDIIYFNVQLPHSYEEGTNIEFHIHYVPEDATAGNVRWVFTHSWANINSTFPAETTVTTLIATPEVADQHTIGEIASSITGTGKTISSFLICSLQRTGTHADDTYDAKNIYLLGLDFHILKDSNGSIEGTSKSAS